MISWSNCCIVVKVVKALYIRENKLKQEISMAKVVKANANTDVDPNLIKKGIGHEEYREYEFDEVRQDKQGNMCATGRRITYRIYNPKFLYLRPGGTTHRVVDADGVAHCVPSIGICGCILRWKTKDGFEPVAF